MHSDRCSVFKVGVVKERDQQQGKEQPQKMSSLYQEFRLC